MTIELSSCQVRGFTFDLRLAGPTDGEPVMLLHGFPETSIMWEGLMTELATADYRCAAPNQRGYSAGARPADIDAYRGAELVADVFAIADELDWTRFHLVAHDWGAVVGWQAVQQAPARIASFAALSIPHYRAFAEASWEDADTALYRGFLELVVAQPATVEALFAKDDMAELRSTWIADERTIEDYVETLSQPSALRSMLAWYQASDGHRSVMRTPAAPEEQIRTPTLLIWGRDDLYVRRGAIERASKFMVGPYDVLEIEAGHWLVQEAGDRVRDALVSHLRHFPLKAPAS